MSTGRLLTAAIVTLLAIDIFSGKIFPDDQMANSFDCCKGDVDLFDPGCNQDDQFNCPIPTQSCRFRVSMKNSDSTGRHEHLRNPLMQVTVSWAECVWNGQDDMTCKKVDNRSNYNCTCGRNDKFSKCHPIYMEKAMDKGNHFCPIPNGTDLVQMYQDQIDWNSFPCAYRLWNTTTTDQNYNVRPVPRHRDNNDTIESVINTPICRKDLNSDSNFTCSCVSVSCTKAKLLKAIREVWASLSTLTTTEKTKTTTTTTPSTTSTKTTTTTTTSTSTSTPPTTAISTSTAKISSTITSTPTITSTSTRKTSTIAPTTGSSAFKISSTKSSPSAKSSTKPSWAETSSPEPFPSETFSTETSSPESSSLENFTTSSTFDPVGPTVSGNGQDHVKQVNFSSTAIPSCSQPACHLELKVSLVLLSFVTLPLPIAALILIVRLIRKIRRRRAKNKAERKRQKNAKLARSCAPPDTTANFSNLTTDGRFKRADPTELPARPAATQLNATVAPTEDLSFSH